MFTESLLPADHASASPAYDLSMESPQPGHSPESEQGRAKRRALRDTKWARKAHGRAFNPDIRVDHTRTFTRSPYEGMMMSNVRCF